MNMDQYDAEVKPHSVQSTLNQHWNKSNF